MQRKLNFLHLERFQLHPSQAKVAENDDEIGWINDVVVGRNVAVDDVNDTVVDGGDEKVEEVFYKLPCQLKTKSWVSWQE